MALYIITLVLTSTFFTTFTRASPPAFQVYPSSNIPQIDPVVACNQLNVTIPPLLAQLANEPLTITNPINIFYPEGLNPTTSAFFGGIPASILQPSANIAGAIKTVGEWTKSNIISDYGYGEEDSVQSQQGGLPAFCRFGASITTSSMSNVWFEVWMPLPATAGQNVSTSTTMAPAIAMKLAKATTSSHKSTSSSHKSTSSTHKTTSSSHKNTSSTTSHKGTTSINKKKTTTSSSTHKKTTSTSHRSTSTHKTTSSSHKSTTTKKSSSMTTKFRTTTAPTTSHHTTSSTRRTTSSSTRRTTSSSTRRTTSSSTRRTTSSSTRRSTSSSTKKTTSSTKLSSSSSTKSSGITGGVSPSPTPSSKTTSSTTTSSTTTSATPTPTGPVVGRAPLDRWRGRVVFLGGTALLGGNSYPEMKQILTRYHEVAVSTNAGHFGSGGLATWAINNPQSQLDFGQRGVHVASVASQAVVKAFYGIADRTGSDGNSRYGFNTYFKGSSTGGRQGLSEAQAYPKDYDGIIAGAPAVYWNELNAYQIHVNYLQSNTSSPGYIPLSLYPLIHEQIIEQCDLNDGIMDSVIEDPSRCNPNLQQLLCPSSTSTISSTPTVMTVSTNTMVSTVTLSNAATTATPSSSTSTTSTDTLSVATSTATTSATTSSTATSSTSTDTASTVTSTTTTATTANTQPTRRNYDQEEEEEVLIYERQYAASATASASASGSTATCLTQPQLDNLAQIYKAYTYPDGSMIHEPVLYGSEFSWTVTDGVVGTPFPPAPGWFQYQVLGQSGSASSFNPYTQVEGNFNLIQQGNQINPGMTETSNANLGSFFSRGSKLIHYHGLADQLIPSGSSDRFYYSILQNSQSVSADNYRYFHIPGMAHSRGGDGAWNFGGASQASDPGSRPLSYDAQHDMLLALFQWFESGTAPDYIIGAAYNSYSGESPSNIGANTDQRPYGNGLKFSHKMCPYPKQAVLTDPSNPYSADSQSCQYT
jgi:hypothetical protein